MASAAPPPAPEPLPWGPGSSSPDQASGSELGWLESLYRLSRALTGELPFATLMERILEEALGETGADSGSLMLLNPHTERLDIVASLGLDPEVVRQEHPRVGEGIAGWVARHGRPLLLSNARPDERFPGLGRRATVRSALCVPLAAGGQVVGVLNVNRLRPQEDFGERDLQLITVFAGFAASAIESARRLAAERELHRQTRVRAEHLALLDEITAVIESQRRVEEILCIILQEIKRALPCQRVSYLEWLETTQELRVRYCVTDVQPTRVPEGTLVSPAPALLASVIGSQRPQMGAYTADDPHPWRQRLYQEGFRSHLAVPVRLEGRCVGVINIASQERDTFGAPHQELAERLSGHLAIALNNALLYEEIHRSYQKAVEALATAVMVKDQYTGGHLHRTDHLALEVAQRLGLSGQALEDIRYGALLHDVGKIGVPEQILLKPGPLDPEEWAIVKTHPEVGARILASMLFLDGAAEAVLAHHERYDGTGYPKGLQGEEIPLTARIVSVVDAYEAMTADRPYRRRLSRAEALRRLEAGAGSQFDPQVVSALVRMLRSRPRGPRRSATRQYARG